MKLLFLLYFFLIPFTLVATNQDKVFKVYWSSFPESFFFYSAFDDYSETITSLTFDSLIQLDKRNLKPIANLAKSWKFKNNGKTLILQLQNTAYFSDGHELTAEDVEFTWRYLTAPESPTTAFKDYYESILDCKVLSKHQVEIKLKQENFINLYRLADFFILPKHHFENKDPKKVFQTEMLGSGPYKIKKINAGESISLEINPKYWGKKLPQHQNHYLLNSITYASIADPIVAFESFKRGDIDFFYFQSSKMWATQTDSPAFASKKVLKLKVDNKLPYSVSGIAWNTRKELFKDKRIRLALSHLMPREKMIRDLFYDNYALSTGIAHSLSPYHHPKNTPLLYSPEKAAALFKEAGWELKDGNLLKADMKFEFNITVKEKAALRYLSVYVEELKKAGITANLKNYDWVTGNTLEKNHDFDAIDITYGRDLIPTSFGMRWSSQLADTVGSQNITGFKNKVADDLILKIDGENNEAKRTKLIQELDLLIASEAPMTFSWEQTYLRIGYSDRVGFNGKGYEPYSNWENIYLNWHWIK